MHRAFPLKRQTVVTCIDTLNKVSIRRFTPRRVARDRRAVCRAGWALRVATIISTVIIIITIIIIGKPKSSSKSKSQIQVPNLSPKLKVQSPEERDWDWG